MIGKWLKNAAFGTKILSAILFVSLSSVSLSFIVISMNHIDRLEEDLKTNAVIITKLISDFAVTPLVFEDKQGAKDALSKLERIPFILHASLLDSNGKRFADFTKNYNDSLYSYNSLIADKDTIFNSGSKLIVATPVKYSNKIYGTLITVSDSGFLKNKIASYINYNILLLILVIVLSYGLGKLIRKPMTKPIVLLSEISNKIADDENATIDIEINSEDEIGVLYKNFRKMIFSIRKKREKLIEAEQKLQKMNEELEETVNRRTILLEAAVAQLKIEMNEREKTNEQLIIAQSELSTALKSEIELNEIKNRFISMVSHEYRTPLTVIQSSASLIETSHVHKNFDNLTKHTARIQNAVDRMMMLLNDVLALGTLEGENYKKSFSKVLVNKLINDVIAETKHIDTEEHKFNFIDQTKDKEVFLDKNAVEHILLNIIGNAAKYSPAYSQITIRAGFDNKFLNISIADNGIGISDEIKNKLFTPFQRGRNAEFKPGTGLGLAIVKRFLDQINGEIYFVSNSGNNTEFTVKIPIDFVK